MKHKLTEDGGKGHALRTDSQKFRDNLDKVTWNQNEPPEEEVYLAYAEGVSMEEMDAADTIKRNKNRTYQSKIALRGKDHPNYDHRIHIFKHTIYGYNFFGTQMEFRNEHGFTQSGVSSLVGGLCKSHHKWIYLGIKQET